METASGFITHEKNVIIKFVVIFLMNDNKSDANVGVMQKIMFALSKNEADFRSCCLLKNQYWKESVFTSFLI